MLLWVLLMAKWIEWAHFVETIVKQSHKLTVKHWTIWLSYHSPCCSSIDKVWHLYRRFSDDVNAWGQVFHSVPYSAGFYKYKWGNYRELIVYIYIFGTWSIVCIVERENVNVAYRWMIRSNGVSKFGIYANQMATESNTFMSFEQC